MDAMGEVLDHGRDRDPRSRQVSIVTTVIAAGLVVTALAAGLTWWSGRPPTSDRLEIIDAAVVAQTPVTVIAEPPVGALATPAGTTLPGTTLRLTVGGSPGDSLDVIASPRNSLVYVEAGAATTIRPGEYAELDVTVAPVDCGLAREGTDLDEAGYRWRRPFGVEILSTTAGDSVPLSESAQAALRDALARSCADAGAEPTLTVTAARRGGEPPLETIGLFVDVDADADRYVLTPLDGPGLRGLGAADRRSADGIPLLWLVSTRAEHKDDATTAYTQVFIVRDRTAYPWIVETVITDDLPEMTPLTTSVR